MTETVCQEHAPCKGKGCKGCRGIGVHRVPLVVPPDTEERLDENMEQPPLEFRDAERARWRSLSPKEKRQVWDRKKPQTRKAVSIKGLTYQRLKDYSEQQCTTVSNLLEKWIAEHLETPWNSHGGAVNRRKTHCPKGHPYSGDNLYVPPGRPTQRQCRACKKKRTAESRKRKRLREMGVFG